MEGIIIIAVLYLVFKAIAKRSKAVWDTEAEQTKEPAVTQTSQPGPIKFSRQPFAAQQRPQAQRQTPPPPSPSPGEGSARRPMTPNVQVDNTRKPYVGSMGIAMVEGRLAADSTLSTEGRASSEGESTYSNSMANTYNEARLAYQLDQPESSAESILPVSFGANDMIRAVVMSEILAKPYQWSDTNG